MNLETRVVTAAKLSDLTINTLNKEQFSSALIVFRTTEANQIQLSLVTNGDKEATIEALTQAINRIKTEQPDQC